MRRIILSAISSIALLFVSCSEEFISMDLESDGVILVNGSVLDQNDKPVEHISVTIQMNGSDETQTCYTSSEGIFRFGLESFGKNGKITFSIRIKDIDGEQNGGLFSEKSDEITLFEEDYLEVPVRIEIPPYHLSRATASANSPQS